MRLEGGGGGDSFIDHIWPGLVLHVQYQPGYSFCYQWVMYASLIPRSSV